jgi:hypothetical protein
MTAVQKAKEEVKRLLRDEPSACGVGITWSRGHQCVLVNVAKGADRVIREKIRQFLPGLDFVIQEVGEITTE